MSNLDKSRDTVDDDICATCAHQTTNHDTCRCAGAHHRLYRGTHLSNFVKLLHKRPVQLVACHSPSPATTSAAAARSTAPYPRRGYRHPLVAAGAAVGDNPARLQHGRRRGHPPCPPTLVRSSNPAASTNCTPGHRRSSRGPLGDRARGNMSVLLPLRRRRQRIVRHASSDCSAGVRGEHRRVLRAREARVGGTSAATPTVAAAAIFRRRRRRNSRRRCPRCSRARSGARPSREVEVICPVESDLFECLFVGKVRHLGGIWGR